MRSAIISPRTTALVVLAGFAWLMGMKAQPSRAQALTAPELPRAIGAWRGTPIKVEDRDLEILETNDVSVTEFRRGEEPPLWLTRVAGFGNRAAFHPPELCYKGSNFDVVAREPISVDVNGRQQRMMRLIISRDGQKFQVWYWFTANGRVTPSYYRQQFWLVMDAIRRKPTSGTLVRLSTPLDDAASAYQRLLAFVRDYDAQSEVSRHGS